MELGTKMKELLERYEVLPVEEKRYCEDTLESALDMVDLTIDIERGRHSS